MFGLHMFNEMEKIHREMDQLLCGLGISQAQTFHKESASFKVSNTESGYRVEAMLPGLDAEKLEINVLGRRLTLAAESVEANQEEGVVWHRRERAKGALKKTLMLPGEIDSEKVEAEYKNGILSIALPKAASSLPKKINVKAG